MLTTDLVPGAPCWISLVAEDHATAARFYEAVLGWNPSPAEPGQTEPGLFRLGDVIVAEMERPRGAADRPAWRIHFAVADLDAALRAVEDSGGSVLGEARQTGGSFHTAWVGDPQGAGFGLREPEGAPVLGAVGLPGTLMWTELYTSDAAGAKDFYAALFGWTFSDVSLPGGGGAYAIVTPAGDDPERAQGGVMQLDPRHLEETGPYWQPVFHVSDCDASVARVAGNGGGVYMGPEDAPGVGRLAVCHDSAGASFVLLTPKEG
ncbi:VOC family protein [Marinactinospora thermotolerans]|uniref:VOC domain-containing protein n=1 Tax=Marinactinospora thermotolerans DSM 45154 TaxID=1122192 RepID=A0A1T4K3L9_9ACTN|nr:VOC family protein [Marinactinospora thermotolerans]SJZ36905.1 hypothetical protein SAMN02745673_00142 [Marinactinospora thermotolerans DSM 45154]